MRDPIIEELFPDRKSIPLNEIFSSSRPNKEISGLSDFIRGGDLSHSPDYLKGDYDLSYSLSHYGQNFFPTLYSRRSLLHLQMICSVTFRKNHYTKRTDLSSFLMAQTFFGKGVLRYEGKEYILLPDDLFFIDCRKDHEYFATDENGWGYRFIHFDGPAMQDYFAPILSNRNVKFTFDKESRYQSLFKELLVTNYGSELNKEIITNRILTDMITEILCQLPQYQSAEYPKVISDLCAYLDNSFREKLTLDQIAVRCSLSKFYMSREFKKYVGKSIFSYIIDLRIDLAQRLLRYSDMSVNEISEQVGFEDHNGFYRAFRQREDMSPSEYRKYWRTF